jgi:SNF2 family DNA or RNA helicase
VQLSYDHKRYVLTARESRWAELRDAGWIFDRTQRVYTTRDWRLAADYIEWADSDELWDDLDARLTALEEEMSASYAMFADADIARPHITNHKGEVLDYLPYQKAGILYAAERDDTLIGDSPGLGKTIQAIGLINHLGLQCGLIVCPATLKLNWLKEMLKWLVDKNLTVGVAYGGDIPDTDFVIINYDILARNRDALWAERWDILVCDEAQYLSNGESKRTRVVFGTYTMDWTTKKVRRKPERIKQRHGGVEKVTCLRANTRLMLPARR